MGASVIKKGEVKGNAEMQNGGSRNLEEEKGDAGGVKETGAGVQGVKSDVQEAETDKTAGFGDTILIKSVESMQKDIVELRGRLEVSETKRRNLGKAIRKTAPVSRKATSKPVQKMNDDFLSWLLG